MAKTVYFGISLTAFKEKLRENKGGAFVFYGEEELLKKFYLEKLTSMIEKEGMTDFNLSRLDFSRKSGLGELEEEIGIMPVMAEHRLIIVTGLDIIKLTNDDMKRLSAMLTDIPEYLYIVIYQSETEFLPDRDAQKKAAVKMLSEKAVFVPFPLQTEKTLFSWSQKLCATEKVSLSGDAFRLLADLTEGRMQPMKNELDKLIMYAVSQNKPEITREDVAIFVEGNPEFAIYQLSDAAVIGDVSAVENILSSLKRHKTEPVTIVSSLSRTVVGVIFALSGASAEEAQKGCGLRDWQFNNLKVKVAGKKVENAEKALSLCLSTDRKIKSANSDPFILAESLALGIAGYMR